MRKAILWVAVVCCLVGCSRRPADSAESIEPLLNEDYFQVLHKEIAESEKEIIVSVFLFKTSPSPRGRTRRIGAALKKAARRGLRVVVLLEKSTQRGLNEANGKTAADLKDAGVLVLYDKPARTLHTKMVIIDREIVLLGSHNLTESALKHNHEASLRIRSKTLASRLVEYLDTIHPSVRD
jgi:phosphatidylserine/phosphatidylglycerophosphate/cardiolipin synthase-like enzyme